MAVIAQRQSNNFDQINRNYKKIITTLDNFNREIFPSQEEAPQDFSGVDVLGDYDVNLDYYTQLGNLFSSGQALGQQIISDNNLLAKKADSFVLTVFYGDRFDDLLVDTNDHGQELVDFFSYWAEANDIGLEIFQASDIIGQALVETVARGLDASSLLRLEEEINKVDRLVEKLDKVYLVYSLPEDLSRFHNKNKESLEEDLVLFKSLSVGLANWDALAVERDLGSLFLRAYQENQTALVNELAFWRNSQTMARSAQLGSTWKEANQEISQKLSLF